MRGSRGERRNAELFYAELIGRSVSTRPGLRPNAESFFEELTGRARRTSSPALESLAEAPPLAGKAPVVTPGKDKDEIIVTRADGTRFHVRRKVRAKVLTDPGRLRTGFCSDDNRVFFRLRWCEGTQGTIDFGANPQGAFKDLINKVFRQISQGASPDAIKQTFENASVQPFLEFDITKRDGFVITGDVKLDINRSGLTSATGKVSADVGWVKVGVEGKVGADGKQVLVVVDIPLSKRKIAGKQCQPRELAVWWEAECLREVPITITLKPPVGFIEKHEQLYLYFDHAKTTLRRDPKTAVRPEEELDAILRSDPGLGTARLNKRALERLDYLVGQGYWLTSVDGYASPEGKRPKPKEKLADPEWEGNDALALKRAEKVLKLLIARYRPYMGMRAAPGQPPLMRVPSDLQLPRVAGRSEHPRLDTRLGQELEGQALDRAIILGDATLGVKPFLVEHPDELARMTEDDQKFVTDKRRPLRDRAERVFQNLRRVDIHLLQREPMKDARIPSFTFETVHNCPQDVIEAAEREWGSRIPFTKRDPPVCL